MVYGNWDSNLVVKMEYDRTSPIDLYGKLKLAGEGLVKELHNNWTIVRPTAVYGEGDDPNRVLPTFIRIAKEDGVIEVKGHDNCLDFTHVSDVVQAVRLMIENPNRSKNPCNIFNVSYGQSHALDIVADFICKQVGKGSYTIAQRDYDYPRRGALSLHKIKSDLSYEPKISVEEGIKALLCK
jgi:nucleoside-diphosphate-sugar epimerase